MSSVVLEDEHLKEVAHTLGMPEYEASGDVHHDDLETYIGFFVQGIPETYDNPHVVSWMDRRLPGTRWKLMMLCRIHGIVLPHSYMNEWMKDQLLEHFMQTSCHWGWGPCLVMRGIKCVGDWSLFGVHGRNLFICDLLKQPRLPVCSMQRVLRCLDTEFEVSSDFRTCKEVLQSYLKLGGCSHGGPC